jgi:hypothetical protein
VIRSLTPPQAAGNALACAVQGVQILRNEEYLTVRRSDDQPSPRLWPDESAFAEASAFAGASA